MSLGLQIAAAQALSIVSLYGVYTETQRFLITSPLLNKPSPTTTTTTTTTATTPFSTTATPKGDTTNVSTVEQQRISGPTAQVIAGALSGLTLATLSHLLHTPTFPETSAETRAALLAAQASASQQRHLGRPSTVDTVTAAPSRTAFWRSGLKTASGYACFFAVAEGLRTGIYKARLVAAHRAFQSATQNGPPPHIRSLAPTAADLLPPRQNDPTWHLTNFFAGGVAGLAYRAATLPFYAGPVENPLLAKGGLGILAGTFVAMGMLMVGVGVADEAWGEVSRERWERVGGVDVIQG
ncbi:uncharacterized protein EV422DRAFT_291303 [Fimicolochytrium jonesii]|uniref:uncharacterized protein n=1 Tax=Fimicolochytrium jonesii TaxID=1396493 RepID=UPI0022FE55B8|nr:uncharacterized protein EV422DRAFT_291303 [Fimicolochytrium jonesii]KAI8816409.1 hypothetical protein EV422DRAFT_291303 [Fimicolochytrium jonesii]